MSLKTWAQERFRAVLWFYKACHTGRVWFSYQKRSLWKDLPEAQKIVELKQGLDDFSCRELDLYLQRFYLRHFLRGHEFALAVSDPPESKKLRLDFEQNVLKQYRNRGLDDYLPAESLYFHHGLRDAPHAVKEYISDKIFVDGGACYGDSTLAFQQYNPKKVIAFDISKRMAIKFREVMKRNHIPEDRAVLVLKGLGEQKCEMSFSDESIGSTTLMVSGESKVSIISLDSCPEVDGPVGIIKLDLEGFGLQAVKGMVETLKRDRPVLSVAIYHNEEEFFGIKPFLESLDLNYKIEIKCCSFDYMGELTLFAYPAELSGGAKI